ncbi:MAG: NAD-dependent epimerase/dehydratase family protein [Deltaproteobacteria bacterium]|nr:NAD-dependent epimerase/dehydratase family protein [Deltaproteobacteria bacterium]
MANATQVVSPPLEAREHRYPVLRDFYRGQTVFVTGATGFVGGHVARGLLDLGAKVRILARETSSKARVRELQDRGAEFHFGDLGDRDAVLRAADGANYIFHIGALYREAKFADEVFFRANLEGTRHVIDAAERNHSARLVYCSTSGVHSHIEHPPADESAPFHPADVYQRSKAEAELLVKRCHDEGRIRATVIRPGMIWGDDDTRFLKLFRGVSQGRMPLIGLGETWTHWIYVVDLADAFLLAPTTEASLGEAYLVAGEKPILMTEVFQTLSKLGGRESYKLRIPALPVQILGSIVESICRPFGIEPPIFRRRVDFFVKNRAFKTDKVKRDFGFRSRYSFEQEAARIFAAYREAGLLRS